MEENVKNAIFHYENGFITKGHGPNENYVPQQITGDNGIPLNVNQIGGTEPLPGDEPQQEGPSFIDSIKDSLEKAADNNFTLQGAFDAFTNSKWMKEQPLYRAIMLTDEEKLLDAQKIGDKVGLNPQLLADNQFLYEKAKDIYEKMNQKAFLDGKDFSSDSITELYPEVDLSNPVQAAIALKHAEEILRSRNVIQGGIANNIKELGASTWDTVVKSWEAGDATYESGELQYKAMTGELSNDEVEEKLKSLEETEKKYKAAISDSMIATVAGEAIKMGRSMYRMTLKGGEELVEPLGPGVTMALQQFRPILQSAAVYGGATVLGAVGATGAVAGAGIAGAAALVGALALAKAAVYTGTYRAEAGSAYWDWINKKDAYGNRLYTRDQALGHARRVGHMNAAIETIGLEYALGGISKVLGPNAAMAVIKNKEALTGLIGAGRKAIAKKSAVYAGKQLARTAAPEILEEGLQQAVGDIDENIFGRGGNSAKDILSGAIDAMVQATPAAVGMAIGGAGIAGIGAYRGMRKVATLSKMETAVTEFKRTNEKAMNQQLIALRDKSDLYKKSPETYRKTIQSQLDKEGTGTIYIDAQAAAENEATHEALNQMVESGTITSKELDNSIKTGKPLELEAGKYLQTATPETHEVLADYSTMDKGERTLHAIKEERQRYKDMIDIVTSTKEKREAAASEKILNDHFSEDTEKGREDRATAQELLSGGLDHLQENYKSLLEEAKKAWGDLSGVKELQDYMERRKTQDANTSGEKGVDFIDVGEGADRVHIRESKNPDWYQGFYSDHDRAPTQRELYDVAHQKIIKEVFYDNSEDSHMGTQELEAAKAKVESLERVGEVIKTLDKKDLVAQTLLDPDTYEQAYKPLLEQITKAGNKEVTQAARGSALILAKLAENFHKNYGVPLKLATIKAGEITGLAPEALGQMAGENARTAPLEKLREAEQMEQDGAVPEEIWNKTGWLRGPEGIWRFEIPDDLEGIHLDRLSEEELYIDEIYTNEELYEAYPDLRDTKIRIADFLTYEDGELAGANGATQGDHIILDKDYVKSDPEEAKKTIIHELQHVIQNKFERGFSKGGSPETAKADIESTLHTLELALKSEIDTKEAQEFLDKYHEAENCLDFEKFFKINAELSAMEKKMPFEKVRAIKGYLAEIKLLKRASSVNDYTAYRMLGGETEAFMIEGRAEEYTKAKKKFIQQMNQSLKAKNTFDIYLSRHPLDKMAYRRNELDKMSDEAKTLYQDWQDTKANADSKNPYVTGKWSMPEYYFSEFGPAVVNFGRTELPFSTKSASELNWEAKLKADEKKWSDTLDKFAEGKAPTRSLRVMNTPLVLQLLSAKNIPLNIDMEKLGRILKKHGELNGQGITINVLKQLPSALANPLMIFTSATKPGRTVVALELKDKAGINIIVPIQLDVEKEHYDVNIITSVYGRRDNEGNVDHKWFRKNVEQGRLEYVNRENAYKVLGMTKEKAHSFLRSAGVRFPLEGKKSKGFSMLRILDESDLVKARTKNPTYYQTAAPEKDLIAYHNVSAEKLKGAIELGGLPMPSLAITKKDIPFGDFGEITLIGNKDMIDPRKSRTNEVFSRDAYTVRKPTVNYEEPSEKDEAAFHKKYSAVKEELEKKGIQTRRMDFSAYDGLEALARMENDEVIKYYYIKNVLGKEVAIKKKTIVPDVRNKSFFEKYPDILKALKDKKVLENDFFDLDKVSKPYYDSIREDINNKKGLVGLSKRLLAKWTTDGHINQKGAEDLYLRFCDYEEDLKKKPSTVIDRQDFIKSVNQIIEEHGIEKFISYVQSEFDSLYKEKYLWDNGKKYKFTLDNVVKLMKKYRGTNNEGGGGINYGFNSLLAFLSKKFTSIRDIRNSKSQLASNAKELSKYKRAESMYNHLQDEAIELRGDYDESLDMDLAELIRDVRDGKIDNMHGFPESQSFIKHIHSFLDAADKVTTDYFEAKPARKVSFDEFSGAIVPDGTPQKTVDFLESKGIEVRKYNQDIEGDRQAKAEELAHELNVYFQTAYHGSPYSFEHFDLGSIGTGEGYRAYGWGLYFSKDRKIAQKYQEMLKDKGTTGGSIYEVDIPDNDVLLDWNKPIREQPLKVKEAIIKFMKKHPDDYIVDGLTPENFDDSRTGEQWYKEVGFELSIEDPAIAASDRPRLASETLNGLGIKGITYEGREDGRCFVVFDDKAISIINRYNQEINKRYQGSYDRNQNVIDIFDGANQSTVIHEGAHMFLSMLEDMSQTDAQTLLQYFNGDEKAATASMKRMQDDLSTIRNWAAYSEGHLEEYKGTALEKEFAKHAADIAAGKEGAEERWIQERFARGFEKYLMDGSAPTKEMQGVFRRFKKWLTDIYKTAKNLGNVKLTPEIKDVFDKMLATEDEINAWAAQRKLESIDKAIDVNKSELGNLKEWAENVKQKAQEKALSYYLSMVKEDAIEQFKESISTEEARFDFLKSLADENELYSIEQVYNADVYPTKKAREDFLKASGFDSEEEFKKKLKESGGTSEEQWHKHIADMVQQYKDEALTPEVIKQMAEDILNSPEGLQKKSRIESMLLEKKVTQYINLVTSMQLKLKRAKDKEKVARDIRKRLGLVSEKETSELDKQADTIARSEEKISKLEKQVKTLKEKLETAKKEASGTKSENKSRKESAELLENNLRAIEAELEKERAAHEKTQATQKDTEATVADLEGQLRTMVDGLRESRKGMWVDKGTLRKDAYNTMSLETISHATSWKWWQNKAKEADAKAMKCAAENDWDGVAYYKKVEAQNLIMSRQAKLNVDEIKKALHGGGKLTTKETDNNGMERYGILGLINRIGRKENPVLLQDDARYFIQHLAYMCGMTKNDAPMPIDSAGNPRLFDKQAILDMVDPMKMKQLDGASLLFDGSDVIPEWVLDTYFNVDSKPGSFNKLTMNDFRDIVKCMKAVYRIGRREYEGNTLGTSFDNAAKEIVNGLHNVSGLQFATSFQRKYLFTDKQKKLHVIAKYARSLALPEMYIERLGPAAYNYLYKPIDIATSKQREMKEQAKKDLQKIFATYSRKEWLEIRNDRKYRLLGSDELFSKEEILVIALNWGTESNRERMKDIVREVNPTYDLNKSNWAIDLQEELETYLTDKDWDFVEKVWNHINSYYAGRSKVQNELYGVPMGKIPGMTFTLKSGRKINGQYYPARYDKDLSQRTSEQSVNDIAKQKMKGATTFGIGMGSTKSRTGSGGQIMDLSLDLYPKYVDEAIQHTTMREATVDVYKLLCREDVKESIINTMGMDGYDFLKQWVVDNWHSPIVEANDWVGFFNRMRCKFNFATMAYRTSTALLNILNIFPLMNEMGPMNALYAIAHFYKDIPYAPGRVAERYRFIKEKSSFMRDRESNMDRDMAQGMRLPVTKGESKFHSAMENGKFGTANINRYGFWLITKTDYMLSMPQWLATYEGSKRKLQLEHPEMKLEDIDAESVRLADKAVRQTFGSGEIKDRSEIMRNGSWIGQITAFYSYTNLVANWFMRDFYKWKDTGSIRPLAESILFCWVLNAVFEGCMRAKMDDKDDDDKYRNKIVNAFFNGGPIGGIPLVRECLPWMVNYAVTGKKTGEITPDIGALDVLNYIPRIMDATKKGDYIEVARNVNKVSNRSYLGFSDTLSDGFWSTVRFCTTENQYTLADLLRSIIFDRPLKAETKKSKKKEDKK